MARFAIGVVLCAVAFGVMPDGPWWREMGAALLFQVAIAIATDSIKEP